MAHFVIELDIPKHDPIPNLWYVLARHDRIFLTKQGDLEHEDFIDVGDMGKIYYDTELLAHEAIDRYYKRYYLNNPYTNEWEAAKNIEVAAATLNDVIESQVMEFE